MTPPNQTTRRSRESLAPEWRKSKNGYDFDVNSDIWQFDGSLRLNLYYLVELDDTTSLGVRKTLARYAEELSPNTTQGRLSDFRNYCESTGARSVNVASLTNWRASLTDVTEYRLGALKSFFFAWHEWCFPGIDGDTGRFQGS